MLRNARSEIRSASAADLCGASAAEDRAHHAGEAGLGYFTCAGAVRPVAFSVSRSDDEQQHETEKHAPHLLRSGNRLSLDYFLG
jgi:hypothetical protein